MIVCEFIMKKCEIKKTPRDEIQSNLVKDQSFLLELVITLTKLAYTKFALTKLLRITFLSCWMGLSFFSFSQKNDAPFWMSENQRLEQFPVSKYIVVIDSVQLDKRRKDQDALQVQLRNQLFELAGRQISVRVTSQTDITSKESVNGSEYEFREDFLSTSAFKSDVGINTALNDFWERKENRFLIGILAIDRSGLAKSTNLHCEGRLKALISRLEGYLKVDQVVNTGGIRKEHKDISSDRKTAIYLDAQVQSEFDLLNQRFESLMAQVETSESESDFQVALHLVRLKFERADYSGSMDDLAALSRKHPRSADIEALRADILSHYEKDTESRVSVYQTQHKHAEALNILVKYLSYDPKNTNLIQLRKQVRVNYYQQVAQELKYQIDAENIEKAKRKLQELEILSDVNPSEFFTFQKQFSELKVKEDKEEIQLAFNKREYRRAWDLIGSVEGRYDRLEDFKSLKRKVGKKLYQEDSKELRSTRPRLYSLFLDCSAKLEVDVKTLSQPSDYYYFTYGAFLARKVRLKSKFSSNGKDISVADYFGLSWRLLDFQSLNPIPGSADRAPLVTSSKWGHELGLKSILGRCVILQAGLLIDEELDFTLAQAYFGELGLFIPIRHLAFSASIQGYTLFEGAGRFDYLFGISWRFDGVRKFSKEDRRALKFKYR